VSRSLSSLYGLIGSLGLVLLSLPQLTGFILFEGSFGKLIHDILDIVSSVGYYGTLIFSVLLIIETVRSLRNSYRR